MCFKPQRDRSLCTIRLLVLALLVIRWYSVNLFVASMMWMLSETSVVSIEGTGEPWLR